MTAQSACTKYFLYKISPFPFALHVQMYELMNLLYACCTCTLGAERIVNTLIHTLYVYLHTARHMGFYYELAFRDLYPASPMCDCQSTRKIPTSDLTYYENFVFQCGKNDTFLSKIWLNQSTTAALGARYSVILYVLLPYVSLGDENSLTLALSHHSCHRHVVIHTYTHAHAQAYTHAHKHI